MATTLRALTPAAAGPLPWQAKSGATEGRCVVLGACDRTATVECAQIRTNGTVPYSTQRQTMQCQQAFVFRVTSILCSANSLRRYHHASNLWARWTRAAGRHALRATYVVGWGQRVDQRELVVPYGRFQRNGRRSSGLFHLDDTERFFSQILRSDRDHGLRGRPRYIRDRHVLRP